MSTKSIRDRTGRQRILERLNRLTPGSPRLWGRMQPTQLLPHLADSLRAALGEKRLEGTPPGAVRGAIVRLLGIYLLPWPKGRIQAPAGAFKTPSAGWDADRRIVIELIERFAAADPATLGASHPSLGRMRPRDWDRLQYKHLDHHLRQFGV